MQARVLRRVVFAIVMMLVFGTAIASMSYAQDGARELVPGEPVTGTLNADTFAETYVFAASEGDTITLRATTDSEDLTLALLLTDPFGNTSSATGDDAVILSNLTLEADGTYVVTMLRGSGADGDAEGEYSLSLVGEITAPGGASTDRSANPDQIIVDGNSTYISLPAGGIEFSLGWFAAVDLNLEIRDPVGGALFFDNLSVASGGEHDGNVNSLCEDATAEEPTELASWPQGFVPAGSYEIIIYYENPCDTGGPQTFELGASVNGESPSTISGVLNPGQRYLARVDIGVDRQWTLFNGGVDTGQLDLSRVANPTEAALGQAYTGTITNEKPKDAFNFEGTSGQAIEVTMTATSGSLDTLLIILDPDGRNIASNDDSDVGVTNSFIATTLSSDGVYTVLATRYGQVIGGTEGNYTLTLSAVDTTVASDTDSGTDAIATQPATTSVSAAPQGSIEITLNWATNADLQLQVREPSIGETIFDDNPNGVTGGILDQDRVGNRGCENTTASPTSYIYWPANRVPPSGTYEVEVWFQSDCNDARPVTFDLSIEVNGLLLSSPGSESTVTTTATAVGNRYMITFTYDEASGTVALGDGGFFDMNSPSGLNYNTQLATAQQVQYDVPTNGRIDLDQRFVVYSFEGRGGDRVSIQMTSLNGTLDPALFLLDPNGVPLDNNDDIVPGENTDSQIDGITLDADGVYFVIATHYGLQYGATIGDFQLTVASFAGN